MLTNGRRRQCDAGAPITSVRAAGARRSQLRLHSSVYRDRNAPGCRDIIAVDWCENEAVSRWRHAVATRRCRADSASSSSSIDAKWRYSSCTRELEVVYAVGCTSAPFKKKLRASRAFKNDGEDATFRRLYFKLLDSNAANRLSSDLYRLAWTRAHQLLWWLTVAWWERLIFEIQYLNFGEASHSRPHQNAKYRCSVR